MLQHGIWIRHGSWVNTCCIFDDEVYSNREAIMLSPKHLETLATMTALLCNDTKIENLGRKIELNYLFLLKEQERDMRDMYNGKEETL